MLGGSESVRTTVLNLLRNTKSKIVQDKKISTVLIAFNTYKTNGRVKRLKNAEIAKKRELGLCYRCDKKYNPSHHCKNRQLQVMVLQPCEEVEEDLHQNMEKGEKVLKLSLSFVVGIMGNHTMKLKGKVKEEEVPVLIDSGATHNFIVVESVEKFSLPYQ